jgi:acetyl-CoA decarbonylase/synthase complex subunit delta
MAVQWEVSTSIAAAVAGAEIICVRHPRSVAVLKQAFAGLKNSVPSRSAEVR